MKKYIKHIKNINSERAKEYRKQELPKYSYDVWEDYKWRNNSKQKKLFEDNNGLTDLKEVGKKHEQLLRELGYLNKSLRGKTFSDSSNELMREMDKIKERMKHIPPGENHEMVKDTEHHVSGLMSNIYRRVHPLEPSPTVIANGGGGTWGYHYRKGRQKLTNRERARLQTFPDDFKFIGNNSEIRTQIGNAVPPLAGKRIGEVLFKVLNRL